jgi:hypothetical protein
VRKSEPTRESAPPPLTGAPARLRRKAYSAATGYTYQYVYQGHRTIDDNLIFVFSVTRNRTDGSTVQVLLENKVVNAWQALEERTLRPADKYGIAKLALFDFFDQTQMIEPHGEVRLELEDIGRHLASLGLL